MRYEMGCVELSGWMIPGGWLGFVLCSLTANALEILLNACGFHPPALGEGAGVAIFGPFIMIGAAVPTIVYCPSHGLEPK
jgi:hypothetical protein